MPSTRRKLQIHEFIDPDTGQVYEATVRELQEAERSPPYTKLFHEVEAALCRNELTVTQWRIWLLCVMYCAWGTGLIEVTQQEIGERLGLGKSEVSLGLKRLVETAMLFRETPLAGRIARYRMPATFAQRGPKKGLRWKRATDLAQQTAQRAASSPSLRGGKASTSSRRGSGG